MEALYCLLHGSDGFRAASGFAEECPGPLYPVFLKALSFETKWLTFAYNKPASGHNTKHYECNILCFLF